MSRIAPASTLAGVALVAPVASAGWAVASALHLWHFPAPANSSLFATQLLRGLLALLLLLGYAGALAAFALFLERRLRPRPVRELLAILFSLGLGTWLAWGALSLWKYRTVGAHLKQEDLWFLLRSLRQVGGEGTSLERFLLLLGLSSPLLVGGLGFLVALRLRGRGSRAREGELAVLGIVALLGAGAVAALHPAGRQAAGALLFESQLLRVLERRSPPGPPPPTARAGEPIEPFQSSPPETPRSVLVVLLESVPWNRLFGPQARPESIPRLLELSRESFVFERAYATSTHSDYAQTSILASLHPRKFPRHDTFQDLSYPRTLFWDPLVPFGYRSAVFSCQNEHWGNMISFLRTDRLQLLRHSPDWPEAPRRGSGAETKVFEEVPVRAFFDWLDLEPGRPFAVYLNFQATHFPYVVPPEFPALYEPREIDFPASFLHYPREKIPVMENRFHNALHYVDWAIGRLVDGLRRRGLWDSTALLLVSDHGEAFYEHGLPTHGTTLYEEQVRTAMLLRLPGLPGRVIAEPVSVLDGVPTLFRLLGLRRHGNFQGRDDVLEPGYLGGQRPILLTIQGMTHEDGVLLGRFKLIRNWDRGDSALFDLELDPGESRNWVLTGHPALPLLEFQLKALLETQLAYYQHRLWQEGRYPPRLP